MKTLDLYITKICNLNCDYCYVDIQNNEESFNYEKFSKRINLLDYEHIKFFGGEPLLKWIDIKKIVESVKNKNSNIKFSIVTNGILIDSEKVAFAKKYNIEFIISVHKIGLNKLKKVFTLLQDIKDLVGFSFIFKEGELEYPYKVFILLLSLGFCNFIFSPEVFTDWNNNNLEKLIIELNKIENQVSLNKNLNIKGIDGEKLKEVFKGCEKEISTKDGEIFPCNRFGSLGILNKLKFSGIYDKFSEIIDIFHDKNRWFYVCPIGWYLDSLKTNINIDERIKQYKKLNEIFINFTRNINKLKGVRNFLTQGINEVRFNLTNQCNLRCKYCYIDFKDEKIDENIAKNIIDFFISQDGEEKLISFFGGEPLLEFSLLKNLVIFANEVGKNQEKKIRYKIATNFLLVNDEKIDFLINNNFEFHISFNGKKEINDNMRDNSTDLLISKLEKYRGKVGLNNITILLAFSSKEILYLYENISYLNKFGFDKFNLEMIFGIEYSYNKNDFINIKNELNKINRNLNIKLISLGDNFLDISIKGNISQNSFDFNNYKANFTYKNIFNKILSENII